MRPSACEQLQPSTKTWGPGTFAGAGVVGCMAHCERSPSHCLRDISAVTATCCDGRFRRTQDAASPFLEGASAYIDLAMTWGATYGIGVLLDLQAAPGSQNGCALMDPNPNPPPLTLTCRASPRPSWSASASASGIFIGCAAGCHVQQCAGTWSDVVRAARSQLWIEELAASGQERTISLGDSCRRSCCKFLPALKRNCRAAADGHPCTYLCLRDMD